MTDPTRPQPVIDEAVAAGRIQAVFVAGGGLFFVVKAGVNAGNLLTVGNAVGLFVTAVLAAAAYFVPAWRGKVAAAQVTPLEDPQAYGGQQLLTADQWERQAARAGKHSEFHAPAPEPEPTQFYKRLDRPTPYPREERPMSQTPRPLGRIVNHDPRSLQYLVPETSTVVTSMWDRKIPVLDQGSLGSCTGNATVGVLGSLPFYDTLAPTDRANLDETEAVKVYSLATELDGFGGTYPPNDTGSSGLAAAKAAQKLGLISGYQHITSLAAAHAAIQSGPFIVGTNWYSGMDNPDATGRVHVTGTVRGGHEYECCGYDAGSDLWHFWNSWGPDWGNSGSFSYSSADFAKLLADSGDATVFVPITQPAPQPTPTPTPVPTPTPTPTPGIVLPADVLAWAERVAVHPWYSKRDQAAAQELLKLAGK